MTEKQEHILEAALELFASEGFASTPTSKIAKKAEVSEGLIFRHFENKQGLLDAIMGMTEKKLLAVFGPVFMESDPKVVLQMAIEYPFSLNPSEFDFWRLQYMLKWQKEYNNPHKMKPVLDKLTQVFGELGYEHPEMEAKLLNLIVEGILQAILKGNMEQGDEMREFLLRRYDL